jgi:hypothetical protein
MSGTASAWSPERRAAQAERLRALNASADFVARKNSGLEASDKVVIARRNNMLKIANDETIQAKCRAWRETPEGKDAASRGGKASIAKRRNDPLTKLQHQVATAKSNQTKRKRDASAALLKALWLDPQFVARQTERAILLSRDPATMVKHWDTRRAGKVPKAGRKRYYELRDKIGAKAALAIVKRELVIARVNA